MQPAGTPTTQRLIEVASRPLGRVSGQRAVIEFSPKLVSLEKLCAGAVVRLSSGEVYYECAIDKRKISHAFGQAGIALYEIAIALCYSLRDHWVTNNDASTWVPPFEGAQIARLAAFTAKDEGSALSQAIRGHSSLATLLNGYEIQEQTSGRSIVEKVRVAISRDNNAKHLSKRFNRQLSIGAEASMRIDFLGQRFACGFIQIVMSNRHIDNNAERALGKLFELGKLREYVKKPKKSFGLFEDERPEVFELLMVGDRFNSTQRQIINRIEALADRSAVEAKLISSPIEAAERVSDRERLAA